MVWAKLDDEILDNAKIAEAGIFGFALHVAAITWCCRNLTDGFVPRGRVTCLLDFSGVMSSVANAAGVAGAPASAGGRDGADPIAIAEHLVAVGLWRWDEERNGYWLHDFLEYNPSREKVLAERRRGSERKQEARGRPGVPPMSGRIPRGHRKDSATVSDGPVPVPVPVPVPEPIPETEIPPTPRGGERVLGLDGEGGAAWQAWRDGVSRGTGGPVSELRASDKPDLVAFANAHAGGLRGESLVCWIAETAAAFVAANDAKYGFTPRRCAL